ncbi:hypothetical protein, partial [Thermocrinis sp.]
SYELTLPQRIYPHLDRLFSVFRSQVNYYIQKRALRPTKSQAYKVRDIPGRFPSRLVRVEGKALIGLISFSKLLAWLSVVETSYLKPQKLLRWINSDKYG